MVFEAQQYGSAFLFGVNKPQKIKNEKAQFDFSNNNPLG